VAAGRTAITSARRAARAQPSAGICTRSLVQRRRTICLRLKMLQLKDLLWDLHKKRSRDQTSTPHLIRSCSPCLPSFCGLTSCSPMCQNVVLRLGCKCTLPLAVLLI
jgi:hypothetical protein